MIVSTLVVVSVPGIPNTMFPFDGNVFSVLKGILDSYGNQAQWVGVSNLSQPISVSYPRVPDIRNPGSLDAERPLKIDLQVAFNNLQGA